MTVDVPPLVRLSGALGRKSSSRTVLCHKSRDGVFMAALRGDLAVAARFAEQLHGDVYYFVQPLNPPQDGRGSVRDTLGISCLFADLDGDVGKLESVENCVRVTEAVSALLGAATAGDVNSGHGRQPYWVLTGAGTAWAAEDHEARHRAAQVLRRFGQFVESVAVQTMGMTRTEYDLRVGFERPPRRPATWVDSGVYELSRVLRVPGTKNYKSAVVPVELVSVQPLARPLTLDEVEAICDKVLGGQGPSAATGVATDSSGRNGFALPHGLAERDLNDFLIALGKRGLSPTLHRSAGYAEDAEWRSRCPSHAGGGGEHSDDALSFGVSTRLGEPRFVWHCHGGCSNEDVASALAFRLRLPENPGVPRPSENGLGTPSQPATGCAVPESLEEAHSVFRRWLGPEFDTEALDTVLAAAAVFRLDGDPCWLIVVSGSGNAKTETVAALEGAGALVTSTIASEGALLSATKAADRSKAATGGLLRKLDSEGLLVIKDFTSILSMNRDSRAAVLAALREVYDGRWERNVGTDGGQTLTWAGRAGLIAACTTAYDSAHAVVAAMGDRFAVLRMDSTSHRMAAGRQALRNVGQEVRMREELRLATGGVLAGVDPSRAVIGDEVRERLLRVADLVTLARTAVERDTRGNVAEAHAPEMPTRFAKMLGQLVRGALAVGVEAEAAERLALRVGADSVPPLRLRVLFAVDWQPGSTTAQVTKMLQVPRTTVDRALLELHALGLLEISGDTGSWMYRLRPSRDDAEVLAILPRNVSTGGDGEKRPLS